MKNHPADSQHQVVLVYNAGKTKSTDFFQNILILCHPVIVAIFVMLPDITGTVVPIS